MYVYIYIRARTHTHPLLLLDLEALVCDFVVPLHVIALPCVIGVALHPVRGLCENLKKKFQQIKKNLKKIGVVLHPVRGLCAYTYINRCVYIYK